MTSWEYVTLEKLVMQSGESSWTVSGPAETKLKVALAPVETTEASALGKCGEFEWELVTVVPGTGDTTLYYMKRAIK